MSKKAQDEKEQTMESNENSEFKHKEAFCLMWYACVGRRRFEEGCGHKERAWNSRDGVTPFTLLCPSCDGLLEHSDWEKDERTPDHKPRGGQLIFRDGTPDEAMVIMRLRLQDPPVSMSEDDQRDLILCARDTCTGEIPDGDIRFINEFQPGWPQLGRVPY